jgi:hypothetical protein
MLYSIFMLCPLLLLMPFPPLPSHHNRRRIDKSLRSVEMRPSVVAALGNTYESLLPSYPERDQPLVLEAQGL